EAHHGPGVEVPVVRLVLREHLDRVAVGELEHRDARPVVVARQAQHALEHVHRVRPPAGAGPGPGDPVHLHAGPPRPSPPCNQVRRPAARPGRAGVRGGDVAAGAAGAAGPPGGQLRRPDRWVRAASSWRASVSVAPIMKPKPAPPQIPTKAPRPSAPPGAMPLAEPAAVMPATLARKPRAAPMAAERPTGGSAETALAAGAGAADGVPPGSPPAGAAGGSGRSMVVASMRDLRPRSSFSSVFAKYTLT